MNKIILAKFVEVKISSEHPSAITIN